MGDTRRKQISDLRTEIFTLKLTADESEALLKLAQANFRTAGDHLRFLLAEAVAKRDGGH